MSQRYDAILKQSELIDDKFKTITDDELVTFEISLPVPMWHPRYREIHLYTIKVMEIPERAIGPDQVVILDRKLADMDFVKKLLPESDENVFAVDALEDELKEWNWLLNYMQEQGLSSRMADGLVGLGGGLVLNVAAYIAEQAHWDLTLIPTSVIGMADGSGGKVRLNLVDEGQFYKHYFKSYYEPNIILIDPRFLETLTHEIISIGMGEMLKHALFQSDALYDYLMSDAFNPESDKKSLLKGILWTASLKSVCLQIDPEEHRDGADIVLRAGHDFSDQIEQESKFTIPHGYAVAMGINRQLRLQPERLDKFRNFVAKFDIPATPEEFSQKFHISV